LANARLATGQNRLDQSEQLTANLDRVVAGLDVAGV
jgi:hypothetical protein